MSEFFVWIVCAVKVLQWNLANLHSNFVLDKVWLRKFGKSSSLATQKRLFFNNKEIPF